jgi:DNA-binding beta-propeller fold protein YncE
MMFVAIGAAPFVMLAFLVASPALATTIFVSIEQGNTVTGEPEGMAVSPDDKYTVATSESTSMAHVIDNASMKLVANVLVDTRPREAQFTADGSQVWVSSEVGGAIAVIDTKTWKIIKKIKFEVPGVRPELLQPVGMLFSKDGKLLFAALGPANRVASSTPRLTPSSNTSLSANGPGTWRSIPTAPSSMSPTVSPTT